MTRRFILTQKTVVDEAVAALSNAAFRFLPTAILAADENGLLDRSPEWIAEHSGCYDGHFTSSGEFALEELLKVGILTLEPPDDIRFAPKYLALFTGVSIQRPGYVYFVQAESGGPIKIGWATSVTTRVAELQTASHSRFVVLGSMPGTRLDESELHSRFRKSRVRGEWFEPTRDLLALIDGIRSKP